MLDSLSFVDGERDESVDGVASDGRAGGCLVEDGREIPSGPCGILERVEGGNGGVGWDDRGVVDIGVLNVDAVGVLGWPGRTRGVIVGGGKRSWL